MSALFDSAAIEQNDRMIKREKKPSLAGWVVLGLLMLGVWNGASATSWDDAQSVVGRATGDMTALLARPELKDQAAFNELYLGVESILTPVVDFDYISRSVMAKYYRSASKAERARFNTVFRGTLVKTYTRALASFNIDRFEVVANSRPSTDPDRQIVKVQIYTDTGTQYSLVYFMVREADSWKLTNVLLDGINLRQIFRNQFADAVSRNQGSISRVIDDWEALSDPAGKEQ